MQETFYQTADAEVSLSDCGCRRHSIRQFMQKPLYHTADAGNTFITQQMQETLLQTVDAEVSLSYSGCRSLSIRKRMQETLYQMQPLSDRVSSASAV